MPEFIDPQDPKRRNRPKADSSAEGGDERRASSEGGAAARQPAGLPRPATSPSADELLAGAGLGKYRILERLAASPVATLYKARDHLLDRAVVIKQLAPHLADDPAACGRFRKEAYVLAQIGRDARYVVSIHELIEHQRGLFLVTEYVPGWSLETLIAKRQLSLQATLELIARICLGLRSVHAAGFIHRDLAPRHVIADQRCRPKLTDFSLAAAAGAEPDYTVKSPIQTAPEIYLREPYDDRVDIYAAGMIAYEMLVGRQRFRRLIAEQVGPPDDAMRWLAWHAAESRPAWPDAHELNPQVPPVLSAIVSRMMAPALEDRFTTVDDVLTLLVQHFSRTPRNTVPGLEPQQPRVVSVMSAPGLPAPNDARPSAPIGSLPGPMPGQVAGAAAWSPPATAARPPWESPSATPVEARTQTIDVPLGRIEVVAPVASTAPPWAASEFGSNVKTVVPPVWLPRPESDGGAGGKRRRSRRTVRRAWVSLATLILIVGSGYGGYRALPLLFADSADTIESLVSEARLSYANGDHARALELLHNATAVSAQGARGYQARDEAVRWLALVEARVALSQGNLEDAEYRMRTAVELGIGTDLVGDMQRELIRKQSAARLRKRFKDAPVGEDGEADRTADAPRAADPPPAAAGGDRQRAYERVMDLAHDAMQRGDYAEAADFARQANLVMSTPEAENLLADAAQLQARNQEIKLADAAMNSGDYEQAVKHLREAIRIGTTPELEKKLKRAVAMGLLSEGRELAESGQLRQAANKFRSAEWRDPDCGARDALAQLDPALKALDILERGDAAAERGEWGEALRLYEEARPALPSVLKSEVERRIRAAGSRAGSPRAPSQP